MNHSQHLPTAGWCPFTAASWVLKSSHETPARRPPRLCRETPRYPPASTSRVTNVTETPGNFGSTSGTFGSKNGILTDLKNMHSNQWGFRSMIHVWSFLQIPTCQMLEWSVINKTTTHDAEKNVSCCQHTPFSMRYWAYIMATNNFWSWFIHVWTVTCHVQMKAPATHCAHTFPSMLLVNYYIYIYMSTFTEREHNTITTLATSTVINLAHSLICFGSRVSLQSAC